MLIKEPDGFGIAKPQSHQGSLLVSTQCFNVNLTILYCSGPD